MLSFFFFEGWVIMILNRIKNFILLLLICIYTLGRMIFTMLMDLISVLIFNDFRLRGEDDGKKRGTSNNSSNSDN